MPHMKTNDLMTITSVALATATLTVATFLAASLEAGNDADSTTAKIATPKFVSNGIEMTMSTVGNEVYKAGDQPAFELTAVNTTDQPASLSTCLAMSTSSPRDAFSRVAIMPSPLWTQVQLVELEPKATKVFKFSTNKNLPANSTVTVSLSEEPQRQNTTPSVATSQFDYSATPAQVQRLSTFSPGVTVLTFSTAVPATPAIVAAR